jgi:subfamily B ATP-binding cassette protein MsbA
MQHSGTYRRLYNMQFSEDDLVVATNGDTPLVAGLEGIA